MTRLARPLALFLVALMTLSGAACGGQATPVVTATPEAKPTAAPTTAPTVAPITAPVATTPTPLATPQTSSGSLRPGGSPTAGAQTGIGEPTKPAGTTGPELVGRSTGKVEVTALWVGSGPQGTIGGTSRVVINVERNTGSKELRVGFFEEEVSGSGPMWRAAGWMAVIMSGLMLGINPNEYRYTFDIGGRADGPSAGGLMTIGTIAAVLGHSVRADVAMTGTINPDGTIGPVGGIPHKIDGAAQAKKRLVLIPAGTRQSVDFNTNQNVDVVDRGRRQGVEVREVSDLYEAYELITGSQLPKPIGMKEVRPALPGQSFERTRSKAKEWYTRYIQLNAQYQALPATFKNEYSNNQLREATRSAEKADAYYGQGLPSASYNRAFNATLYASLGYHWAKVVESYRGGGMNAAVQYLQSMRSVKLKIDGFVDRLETINASVLGDVLSISESYGNVTLAMGLIELGDAALKQQATNAEQQLGNLGRAVLMFALADHLVELAKDSIDIGIGFGKAPPPSQDKVEALADLLRRAAEANLNYFESVVINQAAEGAGLHPTAMKARFAAREFSYTFATSTLTSMALLKRRAATGLPGAYATLGGALNSYTLSSVLVAKYYSIGLQLDKDGNVTGVRNERGLINMLDFAEKRAKEIIGLGVSVGADPVGPVIAYEGAKIDREGGTNAKFDALQGYWSAALGGQIIGILSGKAAVVR